MSLGMAYKPNLNAQQTLAGNHGTSGGQSNSHMLSWKIHGNSYTRQAESSQVNHPGGFLEKKFPEVSAVSAHSPSTSIASSAQYRQMVNDYGPPSLGYTQTTTSNQVPQSKYAELLVIIEELGKEIRPTYAGSKSAMERLKRGIIHARGLVRECLAETERNARS
ncbi:cyclin-dependent kinase 2-associated protein 1 [Rana temporaria]|uniref:cyclin-dependent kinase 2-associated protein 1 n=1 Tax=Rana temporaria TaxID=8407 RepID=UPI001AAD90BA|nr:cyclin-dependent kinase 2-associated protein 1 [Rana temporaria]